jgi:hypothetical protein
LRGDDTPDLGRSGEVALLDGGVVDEHIENIRRLLWSMQKEVQHPRGETSFPEQRGNEVVGLGTQFGSLQKLETISRSALFREAACLQDRDVPCGDRSHHRTEAQDYGSIPGSDSEHYSERFSKDQTMTVLDKGQ